MRHGDERNLKSARETTKNTIPPRHLLPGVKKKIALKKQTQDHDRQKSAISREKTKCFNSLIKYLWVKICPKS